MRSLPLVQPHSLGQINGSGINGLAQNGGVAVHGLQRGQLSHGGNAAAGGDLQPGNCQKLTIQVEICPLQRAVPGNIGGNNGLDARIGAAAAECHARLGGDLLPAVDSDSAVLHVNANGDLCAVFLCHFCREIEVFYGHRAQNAAEKLERATKKTEE